MKKQIMVDGMAMSPETARDCARHDGVSEEVSDQVVLAAAESPREAQSGYYLRRNPKTGEMIQVRKWREAKEEKVESGKVSPSTLPSLAQVKLMVSGTPEDFQRLLTTIDRHDRGHLQVLASALGVPAGLPRDMLVDQIKDGLQHARVALGNTVPLPGLDQVNSNLADEWMNTTRVALERLKNENASLLFRKQFVDGLKKKLDKGLMAIAGYMDATGKQALSPEEYLQAEVIQRRIQSVKDVPIPDIRREEHPLDASKVVYRAYDSDGNDMKMGSEDLGQLHANLKTWLQNQVSYHFSVPPPINQEAAAHLVEQLKAEQGQRSQSEPSLTVPQDRINRIVTSHVNSVFPRLKDPEYSDAIKSVGDSVLRSMSQMPAWSKNSDQYDRILRSVESVLRQVNSPSDSIYNTTMASHGIVSHLAQVVLPRSFHPSETTPAERSNNKAAGLAKIIKLAMAKVKVGLGDKQEAKLDKLVDQYLKEKPFPKEVETMLHASGNIALGYRAFLSPKTRDRARKVANEIVDRVRKIHGKYPWES